MDEFVKKIWGRKAVKYCIFAVLAAMALISLIQGIRNAAEYSQDFQWDAAKALTMRINPYDESLSPGGALNEYGFDKYYLQMEANQFPSLLMLLIPYTFLPPLTARYAWIVSNLIFTAGIIFLLRRTFLKEADSDIFIVFMLLLIAGTPYRNQLGVGQHTLFSFFFFLLAVWFSEREDKKAAFTGTVLCLFICYFKYTLTVPLCLYFVYKKKYVEIAVSAAVHVVLTFVAAVWLGDSFINMIIKPLKVSSALAAEGGIDLGVLLHGSGSAYVLAFIVMAGLFFMALRLGGLEDGRSEEADHDSGICMDGGFFSVLILWSLIITYHRTYDFFVMVAILAFFQRRHRPLPRVLEVGYGVVLLAVFFVLRVFSESMGSKIVVGAMYYVFTIAVTAVIIYEMRSKDRLTGR
ncbi:MAG: DUF2029 domain-containing protein [Lachnospiraceae bacterium]|nr:DUF2029 domain-containing protein [Lachnospiraceae bacterium]